MYLTIVKEVYSFLEFYRFYKKFIYSYSYIAYLFNNLIKESIPFIFNKKYI